jgi:hypothetical protein
MSPVEELVPAQVLPSVYLPELCSCIQDRHPDNLSEVCRIHIAHSTCHLYMPTKCFLVGLIAILIFFVTITCLKLVAM